MRMEMDPYSVYFGGSYLYLVLSIFVYFTVLLIPFGLLREKLNKSVLKWTCVRKQL